MVPVGVEEGLQQFPPFGRGEGAGARTGQPQGAVRSAALQIVLQLPEEDGRDIDRRMHIGILRQQVGHAEIVAQPVQAHPREAVGPVWRRGQVTVERLVVVPEQGEMDSRTHGQGGPVGVLPPILQPAGLGLPIGHPATPRRDGELNRHLLSRFDRPGANAQVQRRARRHPAGLAWGLRGEMPHVHTSLSVIAMPGAPRPATG